MLAVTAQTQKMNGVENCINVNDYQILERWITKYSTKCRKTAVHLEQNDSTHPASILSGEAPASIVSAMELPLSLHPPSGIFLNFVTQKSSTWG
jgi:hypothetical protein